MYQKFNWNIKLLGLFIVFLSICVQSGNCQSTDNEIDRECFMLLVGKDASADGSVVLAHNNDLSGIEKSHLVQYARREYTSVDSVYFPSGLVIPQANVTFAWMSLEIEKGYDEGDAVAVNEYGVAIAGGVALKQDRNSRATKADPLIKNGVTGGIRYIALQRSETARQCVKMLGEFYTQFGVTYPSGVGIADASEVWYIESGGGHSWAAVRVPDSCYWAQANGYRIGYVDTEDTLNYYCSPKLLTFSKNRGLWNPEKGEFDFSDAFGGGRYEKNKKPFYDTRRIWRCQDLLNPGLMLKSNQNRYAEFLVPHENISLEMCFEILRDRYQGTDFENNIDDTGKNGERAIASWKGVHTDVISLNSNLPAKEWGIMWVGIGPPQTTCYIPHFCGTDTIHPDFGNAPLKYLNSSAFSLFKKLANRSQNNNLFLKRVRIAFDQIELEAIATVRNRVKIVKDQPQTFGYDKIENDKTNIYFSNQVIGKSKKLLEME